MTMNFYLFIDESGTPNLNKIDVNSPYFALCGILVSEISYQDLDLSVRALKHKYFNDKFVVLRSYNIRCKKKEFEIFKKDDQLYFDFILDINKTIQNTKFKIICPVINKFEHVERYAHNAIESYSLAISFLIQKTIYCLNRVNNIQNKNLIVVFEKRGKHLDEKVEFHINHLKDRGYLYTPNSEFKRYIKSVHFKSKKDDISGLQIADLMASPIVSKIQFPEKPNPSFDILYPKLDNKDGIIWGYGITKFP
jgi:hypothetical protein